MLPILVSENTKLSLRSSKPTDSGINLDTEEQKNVKAVEITPASVKSTAIQTDPVDEVDSDENVKAKKSKSRKSTSSKLKKRKEKQESQPDLLETSPAEVITSREQLIRQKTSDSIKSIDRPGNLVKNLVRSYNKLLWFAAELEEQLQIKILDENDHEEISSDVNNSSKTANQVNGTISNLLGKVARTIKSDRTKSDVKLDAKVSATLKEKYTSIVDDYQNVVSDYSGIVVDVPAKKKRTEEPIKSRIYRNKSDQAIRNFKNRAIGRTTSVVTNRGTLRSKSSVEISMDHLMNYEREETRPPNNSPTGDADHHIPYQVHPESIEHEQVKSSELTKRKMLPRNMLQKENLQSRAYKGG